MVGDFNKHAPTDKQYERLNILLDQIESRRIKEGIDNKLDIKGHDYFQSKSDP